MGLNVLCRYEYILLTYCVFFGGCCSVDCVPDGANSAAGIKSWAAGDSQKTSPQNSKTQEGELPAGSFASYPLFEGDHFSVTLPFSMPEEKQEESSQARVSESMSDSSSEPANQVTANSNSSGNLQVSSNLQSNLESPPIESMVTTVVRNMGFPDHKESHNNWWARFKRFARNLFATDKTRYNDRIDNVKREFFSTRPYVMTSGGGDILEVAQINCKIRPQKDETGFCKLKTDEERMQFIARVTGMDADQYLDRSLTHYFYFQRPRHYKWPSSNEPIENPNVLIEHAAITVTPHQDGKTATVSGRVFSHYKITNKPVLEPDKAVIKAYTQLLEIPGITRDSEPIQTPSKLPLVLLPYKRAVRFDPGQLSQHRWPLYRTPQLRYAYRTTLWGNYEEQVAKDKGRPIRKVESASWRAWIDAETGKLLELVPQFEFAAGVPVKGKGWTPFPSRPIASCENDSVDCSVDTDNDDCPSEMIFNVDSPVPVGAGRKYCLKLADELEIEDENGNPLCITIPSTAEVDTDLSLSMTCVRPEECLCEKVGGDTANDYLLMNAYAHVYLYKKKLDEAICKPYENKPDENPPEWCKSKNYTQLSGEEEIAFQAAKDKGSDGYVPLRILVGETSQGAFEVETIPNPLPHLTLGEIYTIFKDDKLCQSDIVNNDPDDEDNYDKQWNRPGAQDATLIVHEFAHILMDGLYAGRINDWCKPVDCSVPPGSQDEWCKLTGCPVPLSSDVVHDLADGLSALSNQTNSFGEWWSNDPPEEHKESDGYLRKFDYTVDHFPEHRQLLPDNERSFFTKGYADGQIAAAALLASAEGIKRKAGLPGSTIFETTLLSVLPNLFNSNVCKFFWQGRGDERDCDYADRCDLEVYRYLHFLLKELIDNDIKTEATSFSNKITAGFAKAGIFLVPPRCIGARTDAREAEASDSYCPDGQYGGDAVIDITEDWLQKSSDVPPKFEVWTGPKFNFKGVKAVVKQEQEKQPCNKLFEITIAANTEFNNDDTKPITSGWLDKVEECYATWSPTVNEWKEFRDELIKNHTSPDIKFYYRVVTKAAEDGNKFSSSLFPGKRLDEVNETVNCPPFAVINDTGKLDSAFTNNTLTTPCNGEDHETNN